MQSWFSSETKRAVKEAISAIESQTSAEVVVAVRREVGHYRHADLLGGMALAAALLCVFLYYPEPFDYTYLPLEELGAFALGAILTRALVPLRRALAGARLCAESSLLAARAAFVELGIGRTSGRNGVLVFVAVFERRAWVVGDVGIDEKSLGHDWTDTTKLLDRAAQANDAGAFIDALRGLGPALAAQFPRAADDINELPDEMVTDGQASHGIDPQGDEGTS